MTSLFPNGVVLKTEEDYNIWHLFELLVVKITRFANSELKHQDSIHDTCKFMQQMIEGMITKLEKGKN